MKIEHYTPTDSKEYESFLRKNYQGTRNTEYAIQDSLIGYQYALTEPSVSFFPIRAVLNNEMVGHIALIKDTHLPSTEAFFGFMDVPNNRNLFDMLWGALLEKAREEGITALKGPIQGSIWHSYRCVSYSDETPYITSEPLSKEYYYQFLMEKIPQEEVRYLSALRRSYRFLLPLLRPGTALRLLIGGMRIEEVTQVTEKDAQALYEISLEAFSNSFAYTPLSPTAFRELYAKQKLNTYVSSLYLLYKGNTLVGFLSTGHEDEKILICKTIALKPSYQGRGLGKALAYRLHTDALNRGFETIVYALIRKGNGVHKFPTEHLTIFREYSAFTFRL
jgi:GNAT superfamily N-acetyltransferase